MEERPRSRIRFTLRALLVAVLIVAAYCGGWSHARMHLEEDAIKVAREQIIADEKAASEARAIQAKARWQALRDQRIAERKKLMEEKREREQSPSATH